MFERILQICWWWAILERRSERREWIKGDWPHWSAPSKGLKMYLRYQISLDLYLGYQYRSDDIEF
jgi:hypothetical protein